MSIVDQLCARARQAAEQLQAKGFRVLHEVVFNQVLVTGDSPDQTAALVPVLQQSGECWCGSAQWHGRPVIRISVCSWATTPEDIDRLVAAFVTAGEQAAAKTAFPE